MLKAKTGTKKENLCSLLQLFPFHFSLSKNESHTLSLADHIHLHVHAYRNSLPRVVLSLVGSFFCLRMRERESEMLLWYLVQQSAFIAVIIDF